MAYTSWINKWIPVWNNTKYRIDAEFGYRQDAVTNKTEYRSTRLRVSSITDYHSFTTYHLVCGVAVSTNTRKTTDFGYTSVAVHGTTTFDCSDDSRTFEHNTDGTVTENSVFLHFYCTTGLSQNDTPEVDWTTFDITDYIPQIDREAPVTTAEVDAIYTDSISLKVSSNSKTQYARYSIDDKASWTYVAPPTELQVTNGGTGVLTIAQLKPNTQYTMIWQVRRDYNEVWSNEATVNFTTLSDQKKGYIKPYDTWKKGKAILM